MSETTNVPANPPAGPVVPDYLKTMTQKSGSVDSMATASFSIPRVSMRGKKFRFMEGGEEVFVANDKVEVVIFGVEPDANRFVKTYYDRPYGGANDSNPPACASDDGIRPGAWVSSPQNATCADCPKNRFGSALSRQGKPAKACKDSKRLWVGRKEDVLAEEKPTLYALGVTVMSLKSLSEFGREMKSMNVPISAAVTEVTMVDDSDFPMVEFKCVGFLPEVEAKRAVERADKAEWRIVSAGAALAAPQEPPQALPGQPAPAGVPAQPPQPSDPSKKADISDIAKTW